MDDSTTAEPVSLSMIVNGRPCTVQVDPAATLVEVLRDDLGLTGTKIGCDRGACSACTVWLDGEVVASCMTFAMDARGRDVPLAPRKGAISSMRSSSRSKRRITAPPAASQSNRVDTRAASTSESRSG